MIPVGSSISSFESVNPLRFPRTDFPEFVFTVTGSTPIANTAIVFQKNKHVIAAKTYSLSCGQFHHHACRSSRMGMIPLPVSVSKAGLRENRARRWRKLKVSLLKPTAITNPVSIAKRKEASAPHSRKGPSHIRPEDSVDCCRCHRSDFVEHLLWIVVLQCGQSK